MVRRTLLHAFSTFEIGGPQMRFVQLANHFGNRYRHLIVAMDGQTAAKGGLGPGVDARVLDLPVQKTRTIANLGTFRRALAEHRPDLLVTYNWGAIEWAIANAFAGAHLHIEDGFGPEEAERQLARRVWARRAVLRRSHVVVPSRGLLSLATNIWRLPRRRVFYVPNGIDTSRFRAPADLQLAAQLGIAFDRPVIGTVAGLRPEKNIARLIEAFAIARQTQPARLVIVGDGSEMTALKQDVNRRGLTGDVVFTGACSTPESLLPTFAVFALSSDTEQMPLSILEAMAAGLPVAATDVGDVRDMLAAENRAFVTAREPDALALALVSLLSDRQLAARLGAANRVRAVSEYDEAAMFSAYEALFEGAANSLERDPIRSHRLML